MSWVGRKPKQSPSVWEPPWSPPSRSISWTRYELIQEFNLNDSSPLGLNLEGDEVHLSRLVPGGVDVPTSTPQDLSARIALRLSDELKENIENLATDVGASVNTWIVRNLERSVRGDTPGPSFKSRNQLRGKGRA